MSTEKVIKVFPGHTYIFSFDKGKNVLFNRLYDVFDNVTVDYTGDIIVAIARNPEVLDGDPRATGEFINVTGSYQTLVVA